MTENAKDIRNKIVKFRLSETEYNELKEKEAFCEAKTLYENTKLIDNSYKKRSL